MRHGFSFANAESAGCFDDEDVELKKLGKRQSREAGVFAGGLGLGLIVCGPLLRHRQTTHEVVKQIFMQYDQHVPVVHDVRAAEQNWGPEAPGMRKSDVFDDPDMIEMGDVFGLEMSIHPDAESEFDVADRVSAMYADYQGFDKGNVLFVTSNVPCKVVQAVSRGLGRQEFRDVDVPNASIAPIDLDDPNIRTPIFVPPAELLL